MSFDVITFGEAMVRLTPPLFQRIEQTSEFWVHVGGGEFNVAIGAARLGLTSAWVSALPKNPLGRLVRNKAREHGVNTDHVVWHDKERCGLYFLEMGTAPRPNAVLYDRANSAISFSRLLCSISKPSRAAFSRASATFAWPNSTCRAKLS